MAKIVANMSMSLDGFVAHPADGVKHLFRSNWRVPGSSRGPV